MKREDGVWIRLIRTPSWFNKVQVEDQGNGLRVIIGTIGVPMAVGTNGGSVAIGVMVGVRVGVKVGVGVGVGVGVSVGVGVGVGVGTCIFKCRRVSA